MDLSEFGYLLKHYRLKAGLTQAQVAARINMIGVDADRISRWEYGSKPPSEKWRIFCENALNLPLGTLKNATNILSITYFD